MVVQSQRRRRKYGLHGAMALGMLWALIASAFPVAAMAHATTIPTPVTTGVPRFESGPCVYTLPDSLSAGQNIVCGYVVVAEKHANPGGNTIRLPVAIVKALSATPAPEPIVLLAGGPGQSSQVFADLADPRIRFYESVAAKNDVIFFDQRGTGKSEPSLICTEFRGTGAGLDRLQFKEPMLQAFGMQETFVALVNKCRDRLVGQGVDLTAYTTTENAADVNDVRIALGYQKINLLGASYGSELGLAVARDWGQYVRTNNLASIVPIQVPWYYEPPQSFDRGVKELASDCTANATCNAANPALLANFQKVANDLNAKPVVLTVKDLRSGKVLGQLPLTGDDFVGVMFQFFYSSELVPFLPDMITRSARGNFTWLENLLPLILSGGNELLSYGMHFSVVCSKDPSQANLNAALTGDQAILPEIRRAMEPSIRDYYTICATWPSKNADPKGTTAATSNVPTTLVSGQFDPITPPKYAAIAKETLPNATSVTLPGGGHSAIAPTTAAGACGLAMMLSMIASGSVADTSCVGALKTTYSTLPPVISGDPAPSATPSPSATPRPSPSAPPTPLPSPPATGNGGYLPGLPNTGAGAVDTPAPPTGFQLWWLAVPFLAAAPIAFGLRRRERRS